MRTIVALGFLFCSAAMADTCHTVKRVSQPGVTFAVFMCPTGETLAYPGTCYDAEFSTYTTKITGDGRGVICITPNFGLLSEGYLCPKNDGSEEKDDTSCLDPLRVTLRCCAP